jgi:hypothetical protein
MGGSPASENRPRKMAETAFTPSLITELIGFEDFTDEGTPS